MFNVGQVVATFKADITNFQQGVSSVKNEISKLGTSLGGVGTNIKSFFSGAIKSVSGAFTSAVSQMQGVISTLLGSLGLIGGALSVVGIVGFFKSSSNEAKNFEKAMISLGIIAERFGQSADVAKQRANELAKELNLGVGASAESLQNLLKSGLNIDQATDLLKRFTNEALTGKSANISLSEAVQNLSFAYATGNSALGNMSGISENWLNIIDNGKQVLESWNGKINEGAGITGELAEQIKNYESQLKKEGKTLDKNNDEQAKYIGLLKLTNLTMGSSAKFAGSMIDAQAKFEKKIIDLKIAIGQELNPMLAGMLFELGNTINVDKITEKVKYFAEVIKGLATFMKTGDLTGNFLRSIGQDEDSTAMTMLIQFRDALVALGNWISANQELVLTFITGLAIALGGLMIVATIAMAIGALTNPIFLVVTAIGLLYTAWQTNFLGIQDITKMVLDAIKSFWETNKADIMYIVNGIMEFVRWAFEGLKQWWATYGQNVIGIIKGAWTIISTIFSTNFNIILNLVKFFIAVFKGDWGKAWEAVKAIATTGFKGIKGIFDGMAQMVSNAMSAVYKSFTGYFEKIWNDAKAYADKIRKKISDAFNVTKRNSPSIEDRIKEIVSTANNLLPQVEIPSYSSMIAGSMADVIPNLTGGDVSSKTVNQYITANISDKVDVDALSQRLAFNTRNL